MEPTVPKELKTDSRRAGAREGIDREVVKATRDLHLFLSQNGGPGWNLMSNDPDLQSKVGECLGDGIVYADIEAACMKAQLKSKQKPFNWRFYVTVLHSERSNMESAPVPLADRYDSEGEREALRKLGMDV